MILFLNNTLENFEYISLYEESIYSPKITTAPYDTYNELSTSNRGIFNT